MPQGRGAEEAARVRGHRDPRYRPWLDSLAAGSSSHRVRPRSSPSCRSTAAASHRVSCMAGPGGLRHARSPRQPRRKLGTVVAADGGEIVVQVSREIHAGDGLAFDLPGGPRRGAPARSPRDQRSGSVFRSPRRSRGFARRVVCTARSGRRSVFRNADTALLASEPRHLRRRQAPAVPTDPAPRSPVRLRAGGPLKALFTAGTGPDAESVSFSSNAALEAATHRTRSMTHSAGRSWAPG